MSESLSHRLSVWVDTIFNLLNLNKINYHRLPIWMDTIFNPSEPTFPYLKTEIIIAPVS